jgi:xanthosine utilization system XapX-like protein
MIEAFQEAVLSWQTFYFTTGGASATLVGLMFVALSLGMNLITEVSKQEFEIFVTPSIFYFVSSMLLSFLMLVPNHTPSILALVVFIGALVGTLRTVQFIWKLVRVARRNQDFNMADWLAQIILPISSYLLALVAALCFATSQWSTGFSLLWIVVILLMITAIANTWALVIWILDQGRK